MGRYFRTIEMGRLHRFACYRCTRPMDERLVKSTEIELGCEPCGLRVLVVTTEPIPKQPTRGGSMRYRLGGPIDHGRAFRCHNCGRRFGTTGKPSEGDVLECPRCNTVHKVLALAPAPPSASVVNGSLAATTALSAPSR